MKIKWAIFIILTAFFVTTADSSLRAAGTFDIEPVRSKTVLDGRDRAVIDDFLRQEIGKFLTTRDFVDIAKIRTVILNNQKSRLPDQNQYANQFSESAYKYITQAFQQALILRPPERQTRVIMNLLILIDALQDPRLVDLAMAKLNDENMAVRYWAVQAVTNLGTLKQLNAEDKQNINLAQQITEQLKKITDSSSPEILGLIARFTSGPNIPQAEELLLQIADLRIQRYADWTVKYERSDITILKLLEAKITAPSQSPTIIITTISRGNPEAARRFAQLYSFAIERFIKGRNLNVDQRQQLISLMAEIEQSSISRLLGRQLSTIQTAIAAKNMPALEAERTRLLSDALLSKLNFDYGTNGNGSKRTAPIPLPDEPLDNGM